ncbi:CheY-like chemotaxis protein [Angulomicrobium tetraedrale]|uniref:CheY-like chemotaxis protein n=1 Tax=Ancylobacter tetraedralis TaxID=217068 RepID=A0A839Z8H7_9HYPH|nr:response regulator [Ancylobacter tetraedralis]MBB3769757.1 CheY-like chemotaxis protein [Ancylobacter tetraedralis]
MTKQDLAGRRVFLVEDESLVAMMIEEMIEELGGTVVGTESGINGALDFIASRHSEIDVALLDVNLNGNRSYPIAQAVSGHGIPFVFATGYADNDLLAEWRDRPTLAKPFQLAELEGALALALKPGPG